MCGLNDMAPISFKNFLLLSSFMDTKFYIPEVFDVEGIQVTLSVIIYLLETCMILIGKRRYRVNFYLEIILNFVKESVYIEEISVFFRGIRIFYGNGYLPGKYGCVMFIYWNYRNYKDYDFMGSYW